MPRRRRVIRLAILLSCVVSAGPSSAAQTSTPVSAGTGLMVGRVLDGSADTPVAGATVTLFAVGAALSGASSGSLSVVTGDDGVFVFRNLPAGVFSVRSSMLGYLPSGGAGMKRPGGSFQTVAIADGRKVNDVIVRMWKAGVISGQVVDEQGEPLEGIAITILSFEAAGQRRRLSVQQMPTTDDRGVYRATVTPGDYAVCALFSRHIVPVTASVALAAGTPAAQEMQRSMSGSGAGSASGSGYRVGDLVMISASGQRNVDPGPDEQGRMSVFADACHPSAPGVSSAQAIRVDSGQDRPLGAMTLRVVPAARVFGTVIGPAGPAAGMGVHLLPAGADETTIAIEAANTLSDPSGAFGFIGVPAGSYVLKVTYSPSSPSMSQEVFINQGIGPSGADMQRVVIARTSSSPSIQPTLWAAVPVTVGEADVTGVALVLREGARVSGRVVFDGARDRPTADQLARTIITFESIGGPSPDGYAQPRGQLDADGKFLTSGLVPGKYTVRFASIPFAGWSLKSIMADGRDVSDEPLEISGNDVPGVVITMTDRPSQLSGVVRDSNGAVDAGATVIVFPWDRTRWAEYGPSARRGRSDDASKTGAYLMAGLPAGEYFVVAVDGRLGLKWQDPKTLEMLTRYATRVTIGDGDKHTLDLTTSAVR